MQSSANQILAAVPGPLTGEEREQHRLDRLLELRATIDALRTDQTSRDPLLAWVIQQERSEQYRDS